MRDEAERRKKTLVDATLVVDIEFLEVGPTSPTHALAPTIGASGITPISTEPTHSNVSPSTSRHPLT